MIYYIEVNKNPKKKRTGDCSTRALCNILHISYADALKEQCEASLKTGYDITSRQTVDYIMKNHGWIKQKQPKTIYNAKVKISNLDESIDSKYIDEDGKGILISTRKHWTVVRDYTVEDTWDCRDYCCGIYYTKEN